MYIWFVFGISAVWWVLVFLVFAGFWYSEFVFVFWCVVDSGICAFLSSVWFVALVTVLGYGLVINGRLLWWGVVGVVFFVSCLVWFLIGFWFSCLICDLCLLCLARWFIGLGFVDFVSVDGWFGLPLSGF